MIKAFLFMGLVGLLFSCKKDETKVIMLDTPIAPTIQTIPDLTLKRTSGADTLTIVGTAVNPGFQASATYTLEACVSGTNFADPMTIYSGIKDLSIKITQSDLNGIFLKKLSADAATSVDFRIRAVLNQDAGTGYTPKVYTSAVKTVTVTTYGLPRLDLINSGITQKIESPLGDGKYAGFVKLDKTKAFTLKNPDTATSYGGSGGTLAVNGAAIASGDNGWYKMTANTTGLTFTLDAYMVGLVGSATPNGWGSPDQKMDYDAKTGTWKITTTLTDGEIKFRMNDGWAWNIGGTVDNLVKDGSNLAVTAGNYTITLTITGAVSGKCTIVKN